MEANNLNEAGDNEVFSEMKFIRRLLRDASNPFQWPENFFMLYYRMPKNAVINLIDLLQDRLVRHRQSIPPHLVVLLMLRFFAHGSFQREFSNNYNHPTGQSTASRYLNLFLEAILEHAPTFIQFPSTQQERQQISAGFQRTIRVPHILGLIYGFIVCMKRSSQNEETFFNYKHGSALNVQIIVDCNGMIRSTRIIPGSNNDQFNQFSDVNEYIELLRNNAQIVQEEGFYYILGDSETL